MKDLSRAFFGIAMLCAVTSTPVLADPYPSRPVRMVVPYPPGGSADVLARTLASRLTEQLGEPVIVENKPGAGTALGTREVAMAAKDGYTLLMGTVTSHAMNPVLNGKVGYHPVRDFTAIAPVAAIPFALVAHPSLPVNSFEELVALAKNKPGTVTYASAGVGTSNHLAGEMLQSTASIQLLHVPYRGSAPALTDLLAGHVDVMFDLLLTASKHVQAKSVRALAVTSKDRSPLMPDVPSFADVGLPDYEVSAWFGIFAPAGIPPSIAERLNAEVRKAVQAPTWLEQLSAVGAESLDGTTSDFSKFVEREYEKWGGVIRARGIETAQ